MKKLIAIALSLFVLNAGTAFAQDKTQEKQLDTKDVEKPARIPFGLLKTQHMTVDIKINGNGPYRVIFDTGAPVSLINNKTAKAAGVFPKNYRPPLFALFGSVGQFKINDLEVGGVKTGNVPVMVMDHPTVDAISRVLGPIEGIVGLSFFGRYRITIDYQAKEMTFVPTDFRPPDMMESLTKTLMASSSPKAKILSPGGLLGFRVEDNKDDEPGVTVSEVYPGSPAAKAGLLKGDRLLTLGSRWTDSAVECHQAAVHLRPGTDAAAEIRRDGKDMKMKLKVAAGF